MTQLPNTDLLKNGEKLTKEQKMKYVMFEHAGSGNHGCEAIIRSTCNMLGKNDYYLHTKSINEDINYHIDEIAKLFTLSDEVSIDRESLNGIIMRIQSRLNKKINFDDRASLYHNRKLLLKNAIALSVGGDNYCYRGIIYSLHNKLTALSLKQIKTVLWGCSVERTYLDKNTVDDLKKYSLITARESLTVDILAEHGIYNTVIQCADPAFTLEPQAVSFGKSILDSQNVIGINVSDFMKYYNAYPNATYRNFKCLIEYLLNNTDYYIALIPHVRQAGNDDLVPSLELAKEFGSDRILVADEDFNCMELKYIISKCKMFIGCRTHSTIAAYSTCVPTLVVGYSTKAKGIAKDIFGDYNDLLVDAREFKSDNDLLDKFLKFDERKGELKDHLEKFMPEYINRAYLAKEALLKII